MCVYIHTSCVGSQRMGGSSRTEKKSLKKMKTKKTVMGFIALGRPFFVYYEVGIPLFFRKSAHEVSGQDFI